MNRPDATKTDDPNERLLDALVYAPIGLALEAKELIPKLAERGRGQVALARLAGTVAAKKGQNEASKAADELRSALESFVNCITHATTQNHPHDQPVTADPSASVHNDLPIDDYDDLTAAAIIPMLADLSDEQLMAVETYERANRGRSTILNRITQRRR